MDIRIDVALSDIIGRSGQKIIQVILKRRKKSWKTGQFNS